MPLCCKLQYNIFLIGILEPLHHSYFIYEYTQTKTKEKWISNQGHAICTLYICIFPRNNDVFIRFPLSAIFIIIFKTGKNKGILNIKYYTNTSLYFKSSTVKHIHNCDGCVILQITNFKAPDFKRTCAMKFDSLFPHPYFIKRHS